MKFRKDEEYSLLRNEIKVSYNKGCKVCKMKLKRIRTFDLFDDFFLLPILIRFKRSEFKMQFISTISFINLIYVSVHV